MPFYSAFAFVALCLAAADPKLVVAATEQTKAPLKVFLLAGQSNMVGMASMEHLKLLVNESDADTNEYQKLWNGTAFIERNDVYMKFNERQGKLTAGTGFASTNGFGPELGFGWAVGNALENETVVLIKAAYGGRSLTIDFRPPSSGEGNYPGVKPAHYGWEYRQMVLDLKEGLDKLSDFYPDYDAAAGYELVGCVWFQGWNDLLKWETVQEYGWNLANFIRDVRLDLDAPGLPFVVGELGMHGVNVTGKGTDRVWAMRAAERGVTMLEEFSNNTLFVPTAPHAVTANGTTTTYNFEYHYYGRADTYYHMGQAFGRGMLGLMNVLPL